MALFVPKSELIHLDRLNEKPLCNAMYLKGFRNSKIVNPRHCFLATYALEEMAKEDSFFKTYVDILPKSYDNFPAFFTDEEKTWLAGSPFLDELNDKVAEIQTAYDTICEAVPEYAAAFSHKQFSEMRMLVASRIYGLTMEDGKETDAFVPYADMINHSYPMEVAYRYSKKRGGFVYQALRDIKLGETV